MSKSPQACSSESHAGPAELRRAVLACCSVHQNGKALFVTGSPIIKAEPESEDSARGPAAVPRPAGEMLTGKPPV
jgi:hypothetical protein